MAEICLDPMTGLDFGKLTSTLNYQRAIRKDFQNFTPSTLKIFDRERERSLGKEEKNVGERISRNRLIRLK